MPKWGQLDADSLVFYRNAMAREFEEMHLCASHWKAMRIATETYPSWYKYNVKLKDEEEAEVDNR